MATYNPATTEELFTNFVELFSTSFVQTSYFLMAGELVVFLGMIVATILVKASDRDAAPFAAFKTPFPPGPLFASILVFFFAALQVAGTIFKVVTADGGVSLADKAVATAVACMGAEAACSVIFYGTGIILGLLGVRKVSIDGEDEVEVVRSRSRGNKRSE